MAPARPPEVIVNDFEPCGANRAAVEDYARQVAAVCGFRAGDDPASLVTKLGGRVIYLPETEWGEETGSIYVYGRREFTICLPDHTSELRDHFTVGHELGHYFLHSRQGEVALIATRSGSARTTRAEWEANWFAAALLMPEDEIRRLHASGSSLYEMTRHFNVSRDAIAVRLKSLGLVDD